MGKTRTFFTGEPVKAAVEAASAFERTFPTAREHMPSRGKNSARKKFVESGKIVSLIILLLPAAFEPGSAQPLEQDPRIAGSADSRVKLLYDFSSSPGTAAFAKNLVYPKCSDDSDCTGEQVSMLLTLSLAGKFTGKKLILEYAWATFRLKIKDIFLNH
jgi:hypothetical protein